MSAKDLKLIRITTPEQSKIFRELIKTYHSYVKSISLPGRQIDYLIYSGDKIVGGIGLGSAPMLSTVMMDYLEPLLKSLPLIPAKNGNIGRSRLWRAQIHANPYLAGNWKFTLTPEAPPNTGSRVLSIFAKLAMRDWKAIYGNDLKWIVTFIGGGHDGGIYKGAGWKYLGISRGETLKGRKPKEAFNVEGAKRIHTDQKLIFIKDLRKKGEGEAIVVQGEHAPPSSGEMAVIPTQSHHSYHTVVKNGKNRIVWD